jgi:hypothetical protein
MKINCEIWRKKIIAVLKFKGKHNIKLWRNSNPIMLNMQVCHGLLILWELIFSYQTCLIFLPPVFKSFAGSWKKEKLSFSLQFKFQLSSRIGIPESHRICKNLTKSTESANQRLLKENHSQSTMSLFVTSKKYLERIQQNLQKSRAC